ncbi:MAG TPA: competence/damage-inducible protein A [Edaphocola sp.]|nr:competence/damage-inducible protein A [Edaphocola sp.]
MQIKKAIIICIGDELLIGQIIDTNSAWLAKQLNQIGLSIVRKITISDNASEIKKTLDNNIPDADLIIMTGGLGPTKDDITKQTLNEYFGGTLIRNEKVLAHVRDFFSKESKRMLPINELQADVPDVCSVLFNKMGTAPGMLFIKGDTWIVSLPGVPLEMENIMKDELLPKIKFANKSKMQIIHRNMVLFGKGESYIAEDIKVIENALPEHIKLAYLPHYGVLTLRLSGSGEAFFQLRDEINTFYQMIRDREMEYLVAEEDISIAEAVVKQLELHRLTLSTAESCTGGLISSQITDIPGASKVFTGSVVSYDNEIKNRLLEVSQETLHTVGAVSEETVINMARAVRKIMGTDISVSVSGILGPSGATSTKPVGLVYIGVDNRFGTLAFKYHFPYDRKTNKELVVQTALNLILHSIKELSN